MHQSGSETMSVASDDVWPERVAQFGDVNLAPAERQVSILAGALLLFNGLRRRRLLLLLGGGGLLYRGITGSCPAVRALEHYFGMPLTGSLRLEESITVNKPVEETYALWRHVENLPRFMSHLESVTPTYGNRSHWIARLPGSLRLEWDALLTDEEQNKKLSWRSLPGSKIDHSGSVLFHSLPQGGTEVKIIFSYKPPGGSIGAATAKLLSVLTENQIRSDLRAFKAVAETGERPTTAGQPRGHVMRREGGHWRRRQKRISESSVHSTDA
jgi:uncharacterized membrane protein